MQARILHRDALAGLLELADHSVDAIITDPPYSSGGLHAGSRKADPTAKYAHSGFGGSDLVSFAGDARDGRSYGYWSALWMGEALRVARPGSVLIVFTDWRQLPSTTDAIQAGGWTWRGVVPWVKPGARPQKGRFAAACEYLVWGTKGARPQEGECLPGFFEMIAPRDRVHVTQKPLALMRQLVRIAPVGGMVLDPFIGSGTTAEACRLEGRDCIGFDVVGHWAESSAARLAATPEPLFPRSTRAC